MRVDVLHECGLCVLLRHGILHGGNVDGIAATERATIETSVCSEGTRSCQVGID